MAQAGKNREITANALVALGSNATSRHGDPAATVEAAVQALGRTGLRVVAQSRFYRTPFVPAGAGPEVVNAVVLLEIDLAPEALLEVLHRIEAAFDRTREARWGSRTLDLDLLAVGQEVRPDRVTFSRWQAQAPSEQAAAAPERLVLPHPRLHERAFVLVPAAEVAPEWRHPVLGQSVTEMLAALPEEERDAIVPVQSPAAGQLIRIVDCTNALMPEALSLVRRVFPAMTPLERLGLRAIAAPGSRIGRLISAVAGVRDLVAFDACLDATGRVVGTTGLYRYRSDPDEEAWLAWFCVDPVARGQGVGQALIEHSVAAARRAGFRCLRLYTSTDSNEAAAQRLYERNGFREIQRRRGLFTTTIYREKRLD